MPGSKRLVGRAMVVVLLLLLLAGLSAPLAQAQTGGAALSQDVVPARVLGDGWTITSQGSDATFSPAATGYVVIYQMGTDSADMNASVSLYAYADRASALASLSDPSFFWGHGNTTLQPLSGYGDGPTYRAYPVGQASASGITFVDGTVVVYAEVDTNVPLSQADALCASLATAEDQLLQGS